MHLTDIATEYEHEARLPAKLVIVETVSVAEE